MIFIYRTITVFILSTLFSCNQKILDESIIYGLWEGMYSNRYISIHFKTNKKCEIILKEIEMKSNEKMNGDYEIDFSKKPIPLSIRNIPQLNYSLHTIVDFINEDSIRIARFATRWKLRPISFFPDKDIALRRVKKIINNEEKIRG